MIAVLLAPLALAAAASVAVPPVDNEIEVIGNRLRSWRGKWKLRDGAVTCKTTRSTGDKAIDALGCDAMVECIAPVAPQFTALDEAKLKRAEAEQRANALLEAAKIGECIAARRNDGIAALAAARRAAKADAAANATANATGRAQ
ncbi:MAG: hypothetical protein EAY70_12455 [Sphingomonadales bacterium]|nr:MAG: hypothetical protein EAY70_12455 [Sphingomonadales bacterium]